MGDTLLNLFNKIGTLPFHVKDPYSTGKTLVYAYDCRCGMFQVRIDSYGSYMFKEINQHSYYELDEQTYKDNFVKCIDK